MAETRLAGQRLRARRIEQGRRQADLAREVGISPSYLNLIEHNRRRIGGKLLAELARALDVDPAALARGARASTIAALSDAAARARTPPRGSAEDFAQAWPDWAALLVAEAERASRAEDRVAALTDRLGHDPHLASALHEVLSSVTAIQATASILVDGGLDADWQGRFHRNIHDDSGRLAEASRALAAYLDAEGGPESGAISPADAFAAWLDARCHQPLGAAEELPPDPAVRALAGPWAERAAADAEALPEEAFVPAAIETGHDPLALSRRFDAPLPRVFRRLAALPPGPEHPPLGLAVIDGAGALLQLKAVPGFALPRSGPGCPLWPLYAALGQPGRPLRAVVAEAGGQARVLAYAVAEPVVAADFDAPALNEAVMLVRGDPPPDLVATVEAGTSCRVCPRRGCPARREASVLGVAPAAGWNGGAEGG